MAKKGRKNKGEEGEKKTGDKLVFWPILASDFFVLKPWNPPLFIGAEEEYFVFNGAKSWPFIQLWSVPTVSSKWPSWIQISQLKVAWVGLFGLVSRPLCYQSTIKDHTRV
jgi:hypothetical protein